MVQRTFAVVVCAVIAFTASLYAGSTIALHTPQGTGADTNNGDFVTSNDTTPVAALNTYYSYFVEVPPNQTSLQIQIFDADVGFGGVNEDIAGRDRNRNNYETTASYSLRDPSNAAVTTQFTTGDDAGPANSDNQWLTLYSAGNTVRDNFTTAAFSNNDGTADWAANWTETDGGGAGVGVGAIQVTGGDLRLQDNATGTQFIDRQVNLSGTGLGVTTATLTYSFRTSGNLDNNDVIQVQMSNNGGGAYTTVATHTDDVVGTVTNTVNVSAYIAANTRIRFRVNGGYNAATKFFYVEHVQIADTAATPLAGHWEVRILMNANANNNDRDDINAIGIRASDGDWSAGGTEFNVYADSYVSLGVNPDGSGNNHSRSYVLYPWVTSGCTASQNDFDRDTNQGAIGSDTYTSRSAAFSQTIPDGSLSIDDRWIRNNLINYSSNYDASDYGIWTFNSTITTYDPDTGNYETLYVGNHLVGLNPLNPGGGTLAQPYTGTGGFPAAYRIYLPTDAGTAPAKPYLQQYLTTAGGPQPAPALGVSRVYTVTVNVINPTAWDINFSTTNRVIANVPGNGTVYAGGVSVSQGTAPTTPAVGATGDVSWNPGTVIAGGSATMAYNVTITPAAATTPATGVPSSATDNGTRATYVDETGNATQPRSTYRLGGLCNLNIVVGLATEVALAAFEVDDRGRVSWTTASEAGTIGFNLYREDGTKVNEHLIPAGNHVYSIDDRTVAERYILEEITASGRINRHGPLITGRRLGPEVKEPAFEPQRLTAQAEARFDLVADAAKTVAVMAGVRETGIVRVPFTELAARFGKSAVSIANSANKSDIAVSTAGQSVAWTSTSDALLFFGEKTDSIYSNDRVYRIELKRGEKMPSVAVTTTSTALTSFNSQVDVENDAFPATVLPLDPESDYWFWDYIVSGDPTHGRKTFAVNVPSVASASGASLEVRLQGALEGASHRARVRLNGVPIGEMTWGNIESRAATLALPGGLLRDGLNQVEIEGVLAPAAPFDVFYIDGFAVRYKRFARPVNGAIEVNDVRNTLTAGPFTSVPIVLDISKRLRPTVLTGGSLRRGEFALTAPTATKNAFVSERPITPNWYRSSYEPVLKNQRADYIVIAPASMRAGAEALASLRARDGLSTFVADLEQVYDEFSFGAPTPHAIRAFVAYAVKSSRRPRYVVLAGTGTVDYRGIEISPGPVPPMMVRTNDGLFASDTKIADANNNGIPDVAIGRIPVSTTAELLAYVDKLRYHTSSNATNPVIFSADAMDQQTDFGRASDESALAMGDRPRVRLHIDDIGAQAARDGLMDAWQHGTPLVNWIGHGGVDQIANAGILTAGDAPALLAPGRLPILVAMTCTINRFEDGLQEPLGAALTRQPNGGALAVWSATGVSNHENARELQRTFMRLAAQKPQLRVGELIVLTHVAHPSDTAGIYVLLGDPAVALELPKETTNGGTPSSTGE